MSTSRVIVFGSANHDHVLTVAEFPQAGETLLSTSYSSGLGGKGANQAVAAAQAGAPVAFIGAVGTDAAGDDTLANLDGHGVDTRGAARADTATGLAMVLLDARGRNEIVVAPGANAAFAADTVDAALADVQDEDIVVVQCEIPLARVEQVIRGAADKGATVVVNLAPYATFDHTVFAGVDLLIVNESEAESLLGHAPAADRIAPAVAAETGCACVVTLGEDGSQYATPDGRTAAVPAVRVENVVDTTGAGDVYVGTLAATLARGGDIVAAMDAASAAAARSVSVRGAQSAPHRSTASALT